MADFLTSIDGDGGPREPLPVTIVSAGAEVDLSGSGSRALSSGTNRSGAITLGGTAQELAPANPARRGLNVQNISAGDIWVNETGAAAAADAAGSYKVPAGVIFGISTNRSVSVVGATTGQKFTATEF